MTVPLIERGITLDAEKLLSSGQSFIISPFENDYIVSPDELVDEALQITPYFVRRTKGYGIDLVVDRLSLLDPLKNPPVYHFGTPYNFDPFRFDRAMQLLPDVIDELAGQPISDLEQLCFQAYSLGDRENSLRYIPRLRQSQTRILSTQTGDIPLQEIRWRNEHGQPINLRALDIEMQANPLLGQDISLTFTNILYNAEMNADRQVTMLNLDSFYIPLIQQIGTRYTHYEPVVGLGKVEEIQHLTDRYIASIRGKGSEAHVENFLAGYILAVGKIRRDMFMQGTQSNMTPVSHSYSRQSANVYDSFIESVVVDVTGRFGFNELQVGNWVYMIIEDNIELMKKGTDI